MPHAVLQDWLEEITAELARGAEMPAGDPPTATTYPSRHAFEEETVWRRRRA